MTLVTRNLFAGAKRFSEERPQLIIPLVAMLMYCTAWNQPICYDSLILILYDSGFQPGGRDKQHAKLYIKAILTVLYIYF